MSTQAVLELLVTLKDQASAGLGTLGGALSSIGGIAAGAALAGVGALGAGIVSGIGDAREAALTFAQTEAVIKSTGGAAGRTAEQIADYAGALSAASGASLFGDSQIQEAQNLLLTFTNIKDTTLDAATAISVDMAQALGGEPKAQAIQLGKALNDPINGITALTRVGVTFTEEQKNQIKTMQESGDVAGAQAVILAELNKEFGGSAQAAADADGGMTQFNDRMGELFETIGTAILPALNQLLAALNDDILPALEENVGPAIALVGQAFQTVSNIIGPVADFLSANLTPILAGLGAALAALVPVILSTVIPAFVAWATTAGAAAVATALALAPVVLPILAIGAAVALLVAAWQNDWGGIRTTLTAVWENTLRPIFEVVRQWLEQKLTAAISALSSFWTNTLLPAVRGVSSFFTGTLVPTLTSAATWIQNVVTKATALGQALGEALQGPIRAVGDLFRDALQSGINAAQGALTGAVKWFNDIKTAVSGVVGMVTRFIEKLGSVQIPSWLQGHSPPPLADWFSYIADAAGTASDQALAFQGGLGAGGLDVTQPAGLAPAGAPMPPPAQVSTRTANITLNATVDSEARVQQLLATMKAELQQEFDSTVDELITGGF